MLFHANLEEEERIDKNAEKNDDDQYESNMDSQSDDKECAEDQDICDRKDFKPDEFLYFYVGNLHYNTMCHQVKKSFSGDYMPENRSNC